MIYAEDVVKLALTQAGGAYLFGGKASGSEANPKADGKGLDCSGLVAWATQRLGVPLLGGSWQQLQACRTAGTVIDVAKAEVTRGALLWLGPNGAEHIVISLGNGMTIEARGKAYGIGSWSVYRDKWSAAALIPGVNYGSAPAGPVVASTGKLVVDGDFGPKTVAALQKACGVTADGVFGPNSKRALQSHLHVPADGDIGPITIKALQTRVHAAPIDGAWGPTTTRALQVALNNGTF